MHKSVFAFMLVFACSVSMLAQEAGETSASSVNAGGNWQLSLQGRRGTQQATLELQQDGSKLSGTFQGERDSSPLTGNLEGNKITFNVQVHGRRGTMRLVFDGTISGDKMTGTFERQGGGSSHGGYGGQEGEEHSHPWTATRHQSAS